MSAPWMPLYIADYLADTPHLSASEHGAYMLLIMHYWRVRKLPADDKQLQRIARMTSREWANSRDTLAGLFGENWFHKRIESELVKSDLKSHARAQSGKRGGEAKSLKYNNQHVANATILLEQNGWQNESFALASSSHSHKETSFHSVSLAQAPENPPIEKPKKQQKEKRSVKTQMAERWPDGPEAYNVFEEMVKAGDASWDDFDRIMAEFGDYNLREANSYASWPAALRTWIRNDRKFKAERERRSNQKQLFTRQ